VNSKGFAAILLLIPVLAAAIAGIAGFYYLQSKEKKPTEDIVSNSPNPSPIDISSLPLNSASPSAQPDPSPTLLPGWKTITVNSCQISLNYPESYWVDSYQEKTACVISLGQTKPTSIQLHILANGSSKIDLNSIKKPEAKNLTVNNISGFIQPAGVIENITADVFYLQKNKVLYIGQTTHEVGDTEAEGILKQIISSLQFIGDENSYSGEVVVNFNNHVTESIYKKNNAKLLKTVIEQYITEKGLVPGSLSDLYTGDYVERWNSKRQGTDDIKDYDYKKEVTNFRIKAVLPNDEEFIIVGDNVLE